MDQVKQTCQFDQTCNNKDDTEDSFYFHILEFLIVIILLFFKFLEFLQPVFDLFHLLGVATSLPLGDDVSQCKG